MQPNSLNYNMKILMKRLISLEHLTDLERLLGLLAEVWRRALDLVAGIADGDAQAMSPFLEPTSLDRLAPLAHLFDGPGQLVLEGFDDRRIGQRPCRSHRRLDARHRSPQSGHLKLLELARRTSARFFLPTGPLLQQRCRRDISPQLLQSPAAILDIAQLARGLEHGATGVDEG